MTLCNTIAKNDIDSCHTCRLLPSFFDIEANFFSLQVKERRKGKACFVEAVVVVGLDEGEREEGRRSVCVQDTRT